MAEPMYRQKRKCRFCDLISNPGAISRHEEACYLLGNLTVASVLIFGHVVLKDDHECWEWGRDIASKKYAPTPWGRSNRAMYKAFTGEDPGELDVCHSCDNPKCVNPYHLWLGTVQDNMSDMYSKGRGNHASRNPPKGDDHWLRKNPDRAKEVMEKVRSNITAESGEKISKALKGGKHTAQAKDNMRQGALAREQKKREMKQ